MDGPSGYLMYKTHKGMFILLRKYYMPEADEEDHLHSNPKGQWCQVPERERLEMLPIGSPDFNTILL